jgi:hypothetical protein
MCLFYIEIQLISFFLSSHNDWAWLIRENFRNNLTGLDLYNMKQYHLKNTTPSHTDITRLRKGQVGGQVCFVFCVFVISYLKTTSNQ